MTSHQRAALGKPLPALAMPGIERSCGEPEGKERTPENRALPPSCRAYRVSGVGRRLARAASKVEG